MAEDETWALTPPPLDPAAARQQLVRALRDLRFTERGHAFTLQGRAVFEFVAPAAGVEPTEPAGLKVRLAQRPAQTPQWDTRTLKTAGDLRQCIDEMRRRAARWSDDD